MVEHGNQRKEFDFGGAKGYSICCAAFYAGLLLLRPAVQNKVIALMMSTGVSLSQPFSLAHIQLLDSFQHSQIDVRAFHLFAIVSGDELEASGTQQQRNMYALSSASPAVQAT